MKRFFTLILTMVSGLSMIGAPIDEATAKQFAQNFWKKNNIMGVRDGKTYINKTEEARFVNVASQHGYSEFYIFNNTNGKGYVIMAADNCVTPILGYSYENNFDDGPLPSNFKAWLDGYAEEINAAVAMKAVITEEIRHDWQCLQDSKPLPVRSEKSVSPLVQTKWNQSPYYNDQCPYDYNNNSRTLTGCVATAMAQVMKYWNYPDHGYGSHSYVPTSHPEYGTLYVDFSAVNHQWSAMPNVINSANSAVATLMYHCGVAVEMMYGISGAPDYGSAAYIIDAGSGRPCAENALKTYFGYKSTLHGEQKNSYTDSQWMQLLKNELDNGRPMVYGGFSDSGGHAFVCDGYNYNDYFHFNWGWGGHYNDYFHINSLNPGTHSYSRNQQAIVGIEPNNGGGGGGGGTSNEYSLNYYSNLTMSETEYWFYDNLSVYAEIANMGQGNFSGYIGAAVFYKDGNEYIFLDVMDYWDKTSTPLQPGYYVHGDLTCEAGPPYLPGSYAIAMVYSLDGELWNHIDNNNYNDAFFDIVYSSDIETFSDFSIATGDYLYYGTNSTVNVDIWNSGSSTFYGKFRVNLSNADGSWAQNIGILNCTDGLGANYHYTGGLDFTGEITVEPGSYYMELAFQRQGESSWYYAGASEFQNPVRVEVVAAPVNLDPYEANNSVGAAYRLPCSLVGNTTTVATTGSNLHNSTDIDYYKIQLDPGRNYTITPRLYDSYNSNSSVYYTVDAKFAYSTDGSIWSEYFDDIIDSSIAFNGGTIYFCVMPYFEGKTGTYLLNINVAIGTSVEENAEPIFNVYPNPTNSMVNVECDNVEEIRIYNTVGQEVIRKPTNGSKHIQIDLSRLTGGVYVLQAVGERQTMGRRIAKTE